MLALLSPADRAQVSPTWLATMESNEPNPWTHGFRILNQAGGTVIGQCGFKTPPNVDGVVEIAYGLNPEHQGKGYATEAAATLVRYAFRTGQVRVVCAHTLSDDGASARVLTKCGFAKIGEVIDPEDGRVWRWEITAPPP